MTRESARYFEAVAGEWDDLRAGFFGEAVREAAIARAYLRPEMIVADVGAGTGFMAAGLAPQVARVHVVDGAPAMLEVARRNLAGYTNVEFHLAEGSSIPLPDACVDVVFANMYLHHCPEPLAAIQEMTRLLRPGGRLVITDLDSHTHHWFRTEMADQWLGFERDQIRGWFREVDLVNVIVTGTQQSCCTESAPHEVAAADGSRARVGISLATGTRRVAMRAAVQANYAAAAQGGCGCSSEPAAPTDCCGGINLEVDCCGSEIKLPEPDDMAFATDYTPLERSAVPTDAEAISLGCGNPVAMAGLRPGEMVLDIGSGGGMDAFLAARQVGPHGKVIGVDMTPAMLERATRTAEQAGINNVEFRRGQAEQLPVANSSVDVILSNCVINLCEDKGAVFAEAYRALRPGGRLEISDVVTGSALPPTLRADAAAWAGCVAGALPEGEYLDLVEQAGFVAISTRRSASSGVVAGVPVYSLIVSARK
jgi:ubiquinone/menaquinone biosynthesis C-methylase UbiE